MLILHLKRYGYDNLTEEQAKKQDKVNIERFIDLSKYLNKAHTHKKKNNLASEHISWD